MKVTKIEAQVKTRGRFSIYVDDKYAFSLSELALINSGIKLGMELTKEQMEEFKRESGLDKLFNRTLSLIMRRPRSRWELEDYLKRKTDDDEAVQELLNRLSNYGYINDEDFARRWVENRRLLKPTSKRKLSLELKQKHIDDEIIRSVLSSDETDESEVLKELVRKKRKQSRYRDDTKLMQYLARQGFRYEDIKQAVMSLNTE